jgi:methionyl-tRNA formyltransferase
LILAGKGISTDILYHSLIKDYEIVAVILEEPVPRKEFLKKRIKKLGLGKVIGQVIFQFTIPPILRLMSKKRIGEIIKQYDFDVRPAPAEKILRVKSVNDAYTISLLQKTNPDLVIVNGTRIITKEILNSIDTKFINIHAGITPKYRNVHGAYWAIVHNDLAHCGVTVHFVDPGIDTGSIISQEKIQIITRDNFVTYPLLQLGEGINCLKKSLIDIFEKRITLKRGTEESGLWYHPTLWQYLYYRVVHHKK